MTDLEREMLRQIHELHQEMEALRGRLALVEGRVYPQYPAAQPLRDQLGPPWRITCNTEPTPEDYEIYNRIAENYHTKTGD